MDSETSAIGCALWADPRKVIAQISHTYWIIGAINIYLLLALMEALTFEIIHATTCTSLGGNGRDLLPGVVDPDFDCEGILVMFGIHQAGGCLRLP
jgi:hypothetical protein